MIRFINCSKEDSNGQLKKRCCCLVAHWSRLNCFGSLKVFNNIKLWAPNLSLVIQSCNKIILSVGHEQDFWIITLFTSLIIIPAQLYCRLLCFSFYHKVSVAHWILSKEDATTTVSEFLIRMFNSRLFLVAIVFSCVALECKSLHKLLEISEASIITWIVL